MTLVRITKNWTWPDLMRQTPAEQGVWDGLQFTTEPVKECDYLVVLNRPREDTNVRCAPQHVWAIMQEPPSEGFRSIHRGDVSYSRVYTADSGLRAARYTHSQPALPWHVNKTYDYLSRDNVPQKTRKLSWITTSKTVLQGHRDRLAFLKYIRDEIEFDLYGRGFRPIEDKWDGLAPYRYSLAVENFSSPYYWSEKIADCFLSWTMPIYYGCTRIFEYFPAEAIVPIDIHNPQGAIETILEAVSSDVREKNLDAVAHARMLVLKKYQLFPFVAEEVRKHEREGCCGEHCVESVTVPHKLRPPLTAREKTQMFVRNKMPYRIRKIIARLSRLIDV